MSNVRFLHYVFKKGPFRGEIIWIKKENIAALPVKEVFELRGWLLVHKVSRDRVTVPWWIAVGSARNRGKPWATSRSTLSSVLSIAPPTFSPKGTRLVRSCPVLLKTRPVGIVTLWSRWRLFPVVSAVFSCFRHADQNRCWIPCIPCLLSHAPNSPACLPAGSADGWRPQETQGVRARPVQRDGVLWVFAKKILLKSLTCLCCEAELGFTVGQVQRWESSPPRMMSTWPLHPPCRR